MSRLIRSDPALELELEGFEELEDPGSFEEEGDPFLGGAPSVGRQLQGGPFKGLARNAASALGQAIGGQSGAALANKIAGQVFREAEFEMEEEAEFEAEFEALGGNRAVLDRMQYAAARAAMAGSNRESDQFIGAIANLAGPLLGSLLGGGGESEFEDLEDFEDEADPFLPALIPLAAKALPFAMKALPAAMPLIQRGVKALGRFFRESEAEQATVAIPKIVAGTATELAKRAEAGKPIGRKQVVAVMAREAAKSLGSKPALVAAIKQNRAAVKRAHAIAR